jgi:hypothetical protein
MDLVAHGRNGWMVDVDDVDGLAHWANHVLAGEASQQVRVEGRKTALANSYDSQLPQWAAFFDGFVTRAT